LNYILLALAGFTTVAFLGWLIRVRINLKHYGYKGINRFLPVRMLLLFLPVINLYILADLLTETWMASSPQHIQMDSEDWRKSARPIWVGFLSTFLFINVVATGAIFFMLLGEWEMRSEWVSMAFWVSVSTFLLGWLFLGITMLGINWRQRRKVTSLMHQKPYGQLSVAAQKGVRFK
jgi:hypothetical protein